MIDSSVDLPQPDGPDIATYSPLANGKMHAGERVGLDLVGVKNFGHDPESGSTAVLLRS